MPKPKRPIGTASGSRQRFMRWVQTERAAHEAWARLISKHPTAARLMHVLVANMSTRGAVVASQTTLGELMGPPGRPVHRNTVRRAIQTLERERWIESVQLGGKGGARAYVVNSRVAWCGPRHGRRFARFSAEVLASESEQSYSVDNRPPLRRIPVLMRGEQQLPDGDGEEPPSQPPLAGMEPDLPAVNGDGEERAELDRLEQMGRPIEDKGEPS